MRSEEERHHLTHANYGKIGTIVIFLSGAAVSFLSLPANNPAFVLLGGMIMCSSAWPLIQSEKWVLNDKGEK
jgi:Co/Zn/Cd efflux system component